MKNQNYLKSNKSFDFFEEKLYDKDNLNENNLALNEDSNKFNLPNKKEDIKIKNSRRKFSKESKISTINDLYLKNNKIINNQKENYNNLLFNLIKSQKNIYDSKYTKEQEN